jgi:RNase P/RNase MRP subunit POP5
MLEETKMALLLIQKLNKQKSKIIIKKVSGIIKKLD